MSKNKATIVFCAHSDDQILGCGGSMAKYSKKDHDIYTIIFSYGENSHFWLKRNFSINMRKKESEAADKIIKGKGVRFFDLKESKFKENKEETKQRIKSTINSINPVRIFLHSVNDPHPDHNDVNKIVLETIDEMSYKGDVYSFDVWNILSFKNTNNPKLVVNISDTFKIKSKALKCFKSQGLSLLLLLPFIYTKNFVEGFKNNMRFAEVFQKVR